MAVEFNRNTNLENLFQELRNIGSKGNFTVQPKLPKPKPSQALQPFSGLVASPAASPGVTAGTGPSGSAGGTSLERLMRAIRGQESSGNYRAVNPTSGALGGYQIMPFNLFGGSEWDKRALGRDVSRAEFLGNPALQDAIARWQLGNYLKKYGAAGAAVAWYGGPGAVKNMYSKTTQAHGYPSLYAYWNSVLSKM